MADALDRQAVSCDQLGSPLYADLLRDLRLDYDRGGVTRELLEARPHPVHDAVPLRYLGAVHALALRGQAPALAARYPSCGGTVDGGVTTAFLEAVHAHRDTVEAALATQVQTNEVARAAVLVGGLALLARRHGLPLRTFELGASAGLLSRWDSYGYDTGSSRCGDPYSPLQFTGMWDRRADLSGDPLVAERAACDIAPLDAADPADRLRLLSFVWPDHAARFGRLRTALDLAVEHPLNLRASSADDFVVSTVAPVAGTTTVVMHSIVWQYLGTLVQHRVRDHLNAQGAVATARSPLAWLRMEPAGRVADVRLTTWPGGVEEVLATCGYHGSPITALVDVDPSPGGSSA